MSRELYQRAEAWAKKHYHDNKTFSSWAQFMEDNEPMVAAWLAGHKAGKKEVLGENMALKRQITNFKKNHPNYPKNKLKLWRGKARSAQARAIKAEEAREGAEMKLNAFQKAYNMREDALLALLSSKGAVHEYEETKAKLKAIARFIKIKKGQCEGSFQACLDEIEKLIEAG